MVRVRGYTEDRSAGRRTRAITAVPIWRRRQFDGRCLWSWRIRIEDKLVQGDARVWRNGELIAIRQRNDGAAVAGDGDGAIVDRNLARLLCGELQAVRGDDVKVAISRDLPERERGRRSRSSFTERHLGRIALRRAGRSGRRICGSISRRTNRLREIAWWRLRRIVRGRGHVSASRLTLNRLAAGIFC